MSRFFSEELAEVRRRRHLTQNRNQVQGRALRMRIGDLDLQERSSLDELRRQRGVFLTQYSHHVYNANPMQIIEQTDPVLRNRILQYGLMIRRGETAPNDYHDNQDYSLKNHSQDLTTWRDKAPYNTDGRGHMTYSLPPGPKVGSDGRAIGQDGRAKDALPMAQATYHAQDGGVLNQHKLNTPSKVPEAVKVPERNASISSGIIAHSTNMPTIPTAAMGAKQTVSNRWKHSSNLLKSYAGLKARSLDWSTAMPFAKSNHYSTVVTTPIAMGNGKERGDDSREMVKSTQVVSRRNIKLKGIGTIWEGKDEHH